MSGTHLLLIASTNYDVRRLEAEMPRATAPGLPVPASPKAADTFVELHASSTPSTAGETIDPEVTASTPSPPHQDGARLTGDQAPEALPSDGAASVEPSATAQSEPVEEAEIDAASPDTTPVPAAEDEATAEAPTPAAPAVETSESPVNDEPKATASVDPADNVQPAPQAAETEQATEFEPAAPQIA
ncbi:MAG: hypothetical protein ACRECI_13955, partial [Methyloceanibacter sp.]